MIDDWTARAQAELARKTMPAGALGGLGQLAVQLAAHQRTLEPRIGRTRLLLFAADHGVSAAGVSAWPREVTAQMLANFARGGAAVSVLARALDVEVELIDVGVDADGAPPGVVLAKTRRGTRRFDLAPAMDAADLDAALQAGGDAVGRAGAVDALLLGEMGIGNTSSAAALLAALTGASAAQCVGRGTGIDDPTLARKQDLIEVALRRVGHARAPADLLRELGGLELAAMVGALQAARRSDTLVVVDGFIASVCALTAVRIEPAIRELLIFAHRSAEHGHAHCLAALNAQPLLALEMRLGEGSGAVLAVPLLRAAAAIMREMATFAAAGVSDKTR